MRLCPVHFLGECPRFTREQCEDAKQQLQRLAARYDQYWHSNEWRDRERLEVQWLRWMQRGSVRSEAA